MKLARLAACITAASLLVACGSDDDKNNGPSTPAVNMEKAAMVLETNADIAFAAYSDSVDTAVALQTALTAFAANPSDATLEAAKTAWLVAREPYGQTEVYRFRNSPIDDDPTTAAEEDGPEGDVNAWPLGEALIDYVNTGTDGDDFDNDEIGVTAHSVGDDLPETIDVTNANGNNIIQTPAITIDAALLANTATADDEHDVIAGYHAIEFLLWGQDLNTTNQSTTNGMDRADAVNATAMGGQRPLTDFTTDAHAQRRLDYLNVAAQKLVDDLTAVRDQWADVDGSYRDTFTTIANETEARARLTEILNGMGTLSEGELAGERMQIAFSSNSQEDEHSCFSDNTHRDIVLNAKGVDNSFHGTYAGYDANLDGTTAGDNVARAVNGYGLNDYLAEVGLDSVSEEADALLATTATQAAAIDTKARAGEPFDVLIQDENRNLQNPVAQTILALNAQADQLQTVATRLGLGDVVEDDASGCDTTNPVNECP